ncbi:helix-turn-helix domain-containing protein [Saccharopolyspora spinosa]|uniref:helix-turn-helix domain-containing protein n=1 Tax=Saccharopolyspora spinosa TaxID=60894 RepID=UPI0009FD61BD|nr:helix-turn-helix transcriptional regulator [Saccharopolyspora spinosa]
MVAANGSPRARALAAGLRQARRDRGVSLRELAKHISSDASNLSKIELGKKVPTPELVARILGALHTPQEEYERILELARNASEPNGLTVGMPGITKQLAGSIESEQESSRFMFGHQ